jgi:hypothetical protein
LLIGLAYAAISATPSARFAELAPAFRIRVSSGLRGPDLHHQIVEFQPKIKVLFMSGYAEGLPDMKLPQGADLLQKRFAFPCCAKVGVNSKPAIDPHCAKSATWTSMF